MVVDVPQLAAMSPDELDALFRESGAGEIPVGEAQGAVLLAPGTEIAWPAERLIQWLVWRGKVFNREKEDLLNMSAPSGSSLFARRSTRRPSWFDQKESIVLDYSKTSRIAQKISDEIREVAPGALPRPRLLGEARILYFALDVRRTQARGAASVLTDARRQVAAGRGREPEQLLETMGDGVANGSVVDLGDLDGVHFARFVVLDEATDLRGEPLPASLLYMSDFDVPASAISRARRAVRRGHRPALRALRGLSRGRQRTREGGSTICERHRSGSRRST